MDDEALDLLLSRDVPCVPALYFELASVERGPEFKLPPKVIDGHKETLEFGAESARKILRAGGRLGMGGDYGFAWCRHGEYAKEPTVRSCSWAVLGTRKRPLRTSRAACPRGQEAAFAPPSTVTRARGAGRGPRPRSH
jgi:hypothetical protein